MPGTLLQIQNTSNKLLFRFTFTIIDFEKQNFIQCYVVNSVNSIRVRETWVFSVINDVNRLQPYKRRHSIVSRIEITRKSAIHRLVLVFRDFN